MYGNPKKVSVLAKPGTDSREFDVQTDCWAGLLRAVSTGLLDVQSFDKNEYFYYDTPANGEFHEVVKGKFIAFKGPCDQKEEFDDGTCTLSATDFVHVFGSKHVTDIVRLNSREYGFYKFASFLKFL